MCLGMGCGCTIWHTYMMRGINTKNEDQVSDKIFIDKTHYVATRSLAMTKAWLKLSSIFLEPQTIFDFFQAFFLPQNRHSASDQM